jgi:hypothetical protein
MVKDNFQEQHLSFPPRMSLKATKELTALTLEMDSDQTAIGISPVTSAIFLIARAFW